MFNKFSRAYMPNLVTGRGSISFATTLGKKKIAVLGYMDAIKELAEKLFEGTDAEVRYIATISREPLVRDLFDNLPAMKEFEPDMILAIGGGAVMDVAKGLHLFYENPEMSFEDSLKPFQLPELGKKAVSVFVPTTSGTGSETSSAAVFINEETRVKHLLLSNYLIPHFAVLDPDMVDKLPAPIQIATALDALAHAIEATTALNTNMFTKAIGTQAALDVLENLPTAVDPEASEEARKAAKEKLHMAATMAGMSITNAFTGIVHSYDHPGPAFNIPHGVVCGIMLPYSMKMIGAHESYACIARRLGYTGTDAELSDKLVDHIRAFNLKLGLSDTFQGHGIDEKEYFDRVDFWSEVSLNGMATKLSPANMDLEKSKLFFTLCYYGEVK
ncbi:MAG: iron-containing alcohol dehydrogenase [Clostridia bacterium]|nr:iron-containing alcohol dehydrogenase [Clostridia bacterium]